MTKILDCSYGGFSRNSFLSVTTCDLYGQRIGEGLSCLVCDFIGKVRHMALSFDRQQPHLGLSILSVFIVNRNKIDHLKNDFKW